MERTLGVGATGSEEEILNLFNLLGLRFAKVHVKLWIVNGIYSPTVRTMAELWVLAVAVAKRRRSCYQRVLLRLHEGGLAPLRRHWYHPSVKRSPTQRHVIFNFTLCSTNFCDSEECMRHQARVEGRERKKS